MGGGRKTLGTAAISANHRRRRRRTFLVCPQEMVVSGVPTTAPFHILILNNEDFKAGNVDTGFIPKHADQLKDPPKMKSMSLVVDAAKRGAARRKHGAKA